MGAAALMCTQASGGWYTTTVVCCGRVSQELPNPQMCDKTGSQQEAKREGDRGGSGRRGTEAKLPSTDLATCHGRIRLGSGGDL